MKTIKLVLLIILSGFLTNSCSKDAAADTPPPCAAVSGLITTSTGSSVGLANYTLGLGSGSISYSNLNNTFYGSLDRETVDVGKVCLASITSWPGNGSGGSISAIVGNSYIAKFRTIINFVTTYSYAKFTIKSYKGGILTVSYVASL